MKYEVRFNPVLNRWAVWQVWEGVHYEMIKCFKTEKGARNWVERH